MKQGLLCSFLGLIASLTVASSALAQEEVMATITSDHDSNVNTLNAVTDSQGRFLGINFTTTSARAPFLTANYFTAAQIASGATLITYEGHDVIILKGAINAQTGSHNLSVHYLSNGLTNSYGACPVLLTRAGNGSWQIENAYSQQPVSKLFVQTWSMGVSTVQGLCNH